MRQYVYELPVRVSGVKPAHTPRLVRERINDLESRATCPIIGRIDVINFDRKVRDLSTRSSLTRDADLSGAFEPEVKVTIHPRSITTSSPKHHSKTDVRPRLDPQRCLRQWVLLPSLSCYRKIRRQSSEISHRPTSHPSRTPALPLHGTESAAPSTPPTASPPASAGSRAPARVPCLVLLQNTDDVVGGSAKPHFLVYPVLESRDAARGAGCPPGPTLRIRIPYQPEGCEPLVPLIVEQPGPLHSLFLASVNVEEQAQRKVLSQGNSLPTSAPHLGTRG